MKTGKDVYCEKLPSLTIGEGRKTVQAARQYGGVFGGSRAVIGDFGVGVAARRVWQNSGGHANPGGPPRHVICLDRKFRRTPSSGISGWDLRPGCRTTLTGPVALTDSAAKASALGMTTREA